MSFVSDDPLLAIPGYNAGDNAPKSWVSKRPSDDFDVFVERIPFDETRTYVARVVQNLELTPTVVLPKEAALKPLVFPMPGWRQRG